MIISPRHSCRVTMLLAVLTRTANADLYTLYLHDALPICASLNPVTGPAHGIQGERGFRLPSEDGERPAHPGSHGQRSEEHTSELQSLTNLVCRLLLEKKTTCTPRCYPS